MAIAAAWHTRPHISGRREPVSCGQCGAGRLDGHTHLMTCRLTGIFRSSESQNAIDPSRGAGRPRLALRPIQMCPGVFLNIGICAISQTRLHLKSA
ncbi:hypothetical protein E2C01_052177 [Portunus trituberculatus]|uniref:Uncharacterized protein n=1 Tax=Portunus trituberculatus TaxID=210409 RepID=A0A5B7GL61_PORTR|nr:hypothetical protein [Portunus trituberculatus]